MKAAHLENERVELMRQALLEILGRYEDEALAQITAGMLEAMQEKLAALDEGVPQLPKYGGEIPALTE